MNSQFAGDIEISKAQNRNFVLVDGFQRFAHQSNSFALMLRYQALAERQYRRATEEFNRLKALREELPNPPNSPEPEQNETTCTICETNPIPPENPAPVPDPPASVPELNPGRAGDSGLSEVPPMPSEHPLAEPTPPNLGIS
jgi:hypothetical protein